jgi:putative hydrolase of the HAD superfamily
MWKRRCVAEVTALFWDLGGVVLTNGWDRTARHAAVEKFGLNMAEFDERHDAFFNGLETGRISLSEYLERTVFYRERAFTLDDFKKFVFDRSQILPDSFPVLGEVAKTKKYFVAALNNESFEINEYRIETFNLHAYFQAFFSSCYMGLRKPENEIYRRALYMAHRKPAECVFIDDRALNVESAKQVGMRGIHFQNANQLRHELAAHGVKLDAK